MNKKFKIEVTEEDFNAVLVEKALANSSEVSWFAMDIIKAFGTRYTLSTRYDDYEIFQFFGKQYA